MLRYTIHLKKTTTRNRYRKIRSPNIYGYEVKHSNVTDTLMKTKPGIMEFTTQKVKAFLLFRNKNSQFLHTSKCYCYFNIFSNITQCNTHITNLGNDQILSLLFYFSHLLLPISFFIIKKKNSITFTYMSLLHY